MPKPALILGASGRFGRNMQAALNRHGWRTRAFDRAKDTLSEAARGTDLIVNGWNLAYADWAQQIPALTEQVIAAAKASGAAVLIPGNLYVYGTDLPPILGPDTPHRTTHPLGRIRLQMEEAYRKAGVKTVILRAGDFLDTEATGNWFDRIMAAKVAKGKFTYPGPLNVPHSFAYLPDLTEAAAQVMAHLDDLPAFSDLPYAGFTLTGREMADAIQRATGRPLRVSSMNWLPLRMAQPFWKEAKHLLEMRYLWQRPHEVDGTALYALIPGFSPTPVDKALAQAVKPLL